MKELCIPVPNFKDNQVAEVELKVNGDRLSFSFKVESFAWDVEDELTGQHTDEVSRSLARITRLRNAINNYDKDWELIQIFTPNENARNIQVLYRKRKK
jgi:hypothetical protein